ncbi:hypothetical protein, partial [Escherichia coli]|uniref:hypothetical protein n=1 Tax=Escherichia coli TaxID=562 RepID=UPI0013D11CBB
LLEGVQVGLGHLTLVGSVTNLPQGVDAVALAPLTVDALGMAPDLVDLAVVLGVGGQRANILLSSISPPDDTGLVEDAFDDITS